MKNLAVIPARCGSKALPDKNICHLNGKPLIAYTINSALESQCFNTVMVSTDSHRYADISRKYGADVPFLRSDMTSTDDASTWEMAKEVIENYRLIGKTYDNIMILQPTSPLRNHKDIKKAFDIMVKKNANAVVSVCEAEHSPLWYKTLKDGDSMDNFAFVVDKPRQKLETYYRLNGAIYLSNICYLLSVDNIYSNGCVAYIMDRIRSVDIDDKMDFEYTEFLLQSGKYKISGRR